MSTISPAVRITKTSPNPWSKSNSTGTRESEHARTTAFGACPCVKLDSRSRSWCGRNALPCTKRSLPSSNCCKTACGVRSSARALEFAGVPVFAFVLGVGCGSEPGADVVMRILRMKSPHTGWPIATTRHGWLCLCTSAHHRRVIRGTRNAGHHRDGIRGVTQ